MAAPRLGPRPGAQHRRPTLTLGKDTWFTCQRRPFQDVTDAEINAYYQGWTWPIGSVDGEDWSCGELSKQWTGKKCGR